MRQNRNAFAGRNIEKLFCNSVGDHPRVIKTIQKEFDLTTPYMGSISTETVKVFPWLACILKRTG